MSSNDKKVDEHSQSTIGSVISWFTGTKKENNKDNNNIDKDKNDINSVTDKTDITVTDKKESSTGTTNKEGNTSKVQEKSSKKQQGKDQSKNTSKYGSNANVKSSAIISSATPSKPISTSLDLVNFLCDLPIDKIEFTPEIAQKCYYIDGMYCKNPGTKTWLAGIIGGASCYFLSNSIFKNNPIKFVKFLGTYGATFGGAYYLSNQWTIQNQKEIEFYKLNKYDLEIQNYFLGELPLFLADSHLKHTSYDKKGLFNQ